MGSGDRTGRERSAPDKAKGTCRGLSASVAGEPCAKGNGKMTRLGVAAACLSMVVAAGLAVKPDTWTHETEKDLAAGKLDKTVVTSLGEVMLARALETIVEPREDLGMISAMAVDAKGRLFVAVAPSAKVYRLEADKLVEFATLKGVLVRSLMFVNDQLVAGTAGKGAGVYRIDPAGKVQEIWAEPKVSSVWAVVPGPRGSFYAATGADGQVYHIKADGKAEVVYDSEEKNILSLAADGDGLLYAGTGEKGLIVQIDPARRSGRVLYDAAEKEISALVVGADGVLYAATSDSAEATGSGEVPSAEVKGKPAGPASAPATGEAGGPAISVKGRTLYKGPATPEVMAAFARRDYEKLEEMWKKGNAEAGRALAAAKAAAGGGPGAASAPASRPAGATQPTTATRPTTTAPGPVQVGPPAVVGRAAPPGRPAPPKAVPAAVPGKGNAVYRIDKEGFVRAVFRRPVSIFAMAVRADTLVLATGHGGQVFFVELTDDRIAMLAKVDPKNVMAMAEDGKGRLYLGTAGKAGIFLLGRDFADKGTAVSNVLSAKQISRWGTLSVVADVPAGCAATIATRSGNVDEPDEKTWSSWSAEVPVSASWVPIGSPAGRFLQYRLTLTGKGQASPVVEQVKLVYQADNLAPVVSAVESKPNFKPAPPRTGEEPGSQPMRYRIIQTKAADPNGDDLQYALHFRRAGDVRWIKLAEKVKRPVYVWDTLGVGDGVYQVRVTVSDERSNPAGTELTAARISRPVIVDNTPPAVAELVVRAAGKGKVSLAGNVADATSRVERIEYAVDTNDDWTVVAAADGICDSQRESFSATAEDLDAGRHRIAVRVTDEFNNIGYASIEVTVAK